MTTILFSILQQTQGGSMTSMIVMMVVLFAIMYFFMIRPQNKKQKEIQRFRNALKPGDEVVTAGGLRGVVRNIDENENIITLEVATGVRLRFEKQAIMPLGSAQNANA